MACSGVNLQVYFLYILDSLFHHLTCIGFVKRIGSHSALCPKEDFIMKTCHNVVSPKQEVVRGVKISINKCRPTCWLLSVGEFWLEHTSLCLLLCSAMWFVSVLMCWTQCDSVPIFSLLQARVVAVCGYEHILHNVL